MFLLNFLSSGLKLVFVDQWPLTLAAVVGLLAIYLLLPRPRRLPLVWGIAAGIAALFAVVVLVIPPTRLSVEGVIFYVCAVTAILAGGLLVTQRNPARAALSFALVVLATCGMFVLQAAPFLMAATIIVYAGAIIVTFLFVLMLAQQEFPSDADARSREPLLATATGFVLLGTLLYLITTTYQHPTLQSHLDEVTAGLQSIQTLVQQQELGQSPSQEDLDRAIKENMAKVTAFEEWWKEQHKTSEGDPPIPTDPLGQALYDAEGAFERQKANLGRDDVSLVDLEAALDKIRAAAEIHLGTLRPHVATSGESGRLRPWIESICQATTRIRKLREGTPTTEDRVLGLSETKKQLDDFQEVWQGSVQKMTEPNRTLPETVRLSQALTQARTRLTEQLDRARGDKPVEFKEIESDLDQVRTAAVVARGTLRPRTDFLSDLSGPPASLMPGEIRRDEYGRPHLPAQNSAYLGRSLFGDYLLAVEMGGMLLLVATVGAIAIAYRKPTPRATPANVMADPAGRTA